MEENGLEPQAGEKTDCGCDRFAKIVIVFCLGLNLNSPHPPIFVIWLEDTSQGTMSARGIQTGPFAIL